MNLHDIAKAAGVSTATVSRVVNGSSSVAENTRLRVQKVIDQYSFTPNALARGLIINSTKTIGVLTVDIRYPYFSCVVHSVEEELKKQGYNILLCNTGGRSDQKQAYIRSILEKKADGLILVGSVYRERVNNQHIISVSRHIPVVLINSHINAENIYSVLCNDQKGTFLATRHLIEKGRKRFLYLHSSNSFSGLSKKRGFICAVRELGVPGENFRIVNLFAHEHSLNATLINLYSDFTYDAIVTSDDFLANAAVNTMHEIGISVPVQVSVTGYNNGPICQFTFPHLTSVDSCMQELGKEGAKAMDRVIKGELCHKTTILTPRLIIRSS